jgi:hypothetical protein
MRSLLVLALILFSSTAFAKPKHHPKKVVHVPAVVIKADLAPRILKQRDGGMPDRVLITVRNPLPHPVWVYLECPNSLTETPVGIPGRTTADVNLACGIEPGGICLLNHWLLQNGHEPPQWTP